jgi:hypothetical protein
MSGPVWSSGLTFSQHVSSLWRSAELCAVRTCAHRSSTLAPDHELAEHAYGPRKRHALTDLAWTCRCLLFVCLRCVVDDVFDLATVEVEFAGYGALALTSVVPGPYRLLYAWRLG